MISLAFAIPGDLASLTGGYAYDRHMLEWLPRFDVEAAAVALPDGFPTPADGAIISALAQIAAAPGDVVMVDGLAYGVLPAKALAALGRRLVALVHHPLAYEGGLTAERRQALMESERASLAVAAAVIVTSASTAGLLVNSFGVKRERITIALPGTDAAPRAEGNHGTTVEILAVGSIIPRKAYDVLIAALRPLASLDWRLSIVGSHARSPATAADLVRQIVDADLVTRVDLLGEVDAAGLERAYASADLFVMPSLFEGYGMALAEALARGLPIIATTAGAAAATVPDSAALKVPPRDIDAFSGALARLITDDALRRQMADAAWQSGQELPTWEASAGRVAEALSNVAGATP